MGPDRPGRPGSHRLKYSMNPVYGNFVQSIAGQANKGMGGWMYKVNNETPLVAARRQKD